MLCMSGWGLASLLSVLVARCSMRCATLSCRLVPWLVPCICTSPRVYHLTCLPFEEAPSTFTCPQHSCAQCCRTTSACGGMLFRCAVCPCAYCEEHVPSSIVELDRNPALEARGLTVSNSAFFILCSQTCFDFYNLLPEQKEQESLKITQLVEGSMLQHGHECLSLQDVADRLVQDDSKELFCVCRMPNDPVCCLSMLVSLISNLRSYSTLQAKFMLICHFCHQWFHGAWYTGRGRH
jgi:hypothetical protein